MRKSIKLFMAAWCVFMIGNTYQIFVHVPLMMVWGSRNLISSYGGDLGLYLSIQANQAPLFLTWLATAVMFAFAVRAELLEDRP